MNVHKRTDGLSEMACIAAFGHRSNLSNRRRFAMLRVAVRKGYLTAVIHAHHMSLLTCKFQELRWDTAADYDSDDKNFDVAMYDYLLDACKPEGSVLQYLLRLKSVGSRRYA
jgi:hypothetical protein